MSFVKEVLAEAHRARLQYDKFHSSHEAYAMIKEELEEYWDIVKTLKGTHAPRIAKKELIQIAAMCLCASEEVTE